METIYGGSESIGQVLSENRSNDIEQKFVDALCEIFLEALDITYYERRIVESLFKRIIDNQLNSRVSNNLGLLQQFEKYVLDKSSERLIDKLQLGDVEINHSHATHAKFADILGKIEELYVKKE